MNGYSYMRGNYSMNCQRVVAIAERSAGNETVGSAWMETRTFDRTAPIGEIMDWAAGIGISGKLIISPDCDTEI